MENIVVGVAFLKLNPLDLLYVNIPFVVYNNPVTQDDYM